jgi:SAM-dependent methyltransferase
MVKRLLRRSDAGVAAVPPGLPSKVRSLHGLLDILACPQCRACQLAATGEDLLCSSCRRAYQIIEGVPVLRMDPGDVRIVPLDHRSNPVDGQLVDWLSSFPGFTLNLGAGATECMPANCVEVEYAIFRTTDVVGDAHRLPFADSVFDAALCLNTFEHLHDPLTAARELYRVLRPGGQLFLHTAFLQPLHEEPHHYYNTTEYGLRRWFADYDIASCTVSDNFTPALGIGWQCSELLHQVERHYGPELGERLAATTLDEWRRFWTDPGARGGAVWDAVQGLPNDVRARFAAGFELRAARPPAGRDG